MDEQRDETREIALEKETIAWVMIEMSPAEAVEGLMTIRLKSSLSDYKAIHNVLASALTSTFDNAIAGAVGMTKTDDTDDATTLKVIARRD